MQVGCRDRGHECGALPYGNLKPGKTEALLRYRGKGTTRRMRKWIYEGGGHAVPVPEAGSDAAIRIVRSYKHLGGIVRDDLSVLQECGARSQSGLAAYSPTASKVFGAKQVSKSLRCQFLCLLDFQHFV